MYTLLIGAVALSSSYYGWGNGIIWIDYVACTGSEASLTSCTYSNILTSACTGTTLAGVVCQSKRRIIVECSVIMTIKLYL